MQVLFFNCLLSLFFMCTIQSLQRKFFFLFLLCIFGGVHDLCGQNVSEFSLDSITKTRELTAQDTILENRLRSIHLPLIIITTNDRVEPPYTVMETPEGFTGLTIRLISQNGC